MLEALGSFLASPRLTEFVTTTPWAWPVAEMVHFIGMALLIGTVGILDLRLLGIAKGLPVAQIHRLVPWGVFGFVLCVISGIMFVSGDGTTPPIARFDNLAFQLKMLFLALAGLNVLAFYVFGVARATDAMKAGDDAPVSGKVTAVLSLFFWLAVIYFGRMIMYADDLYVAFFM